MAKPSINDLQKMKDNGEKISMITAYDYGMMTQVDQADIEIVLVGDSAAMVMLGYEDTRPIGMDEMVLFSKAVTRAAQETFIVGDLPFMSYEVDAQEAARNAGRLMKEGLVDAVKLEGGQEVTESVSAIVNAGIPVMGHIGLTPQKIAMLGGFKVQGKNTEMAMELVKDAKALEEAGAFAIILEAIPASLAKIVTERVNVPTIGIGAGPNCDGQVLVLHDMLTMFDKFVPKFVKQYADIGKEIRTALDEYSQEIKSGQFPEKEHSFSMKSEQVQELEKMLSEQLDE